MKYNKPEIEILELDLIDVIQTSTEGDSDDGKDRPNELPGF